MERGGWRKTPEKKKLQDREIEQEIEREGEGRGGRHEEKISERQENRHT